MKKIVSLLLAFVMLAALCACGGGKTEEKVIDLEALGAELTQGSLFSDTMTRQDAGIAARLYGYGDGEVTNCVLYTGTGATAEEIFLAQASDAKAASELKADCETRIEHQKTTFENYVPEELVKLDDAVLVTSGNYVILVVSGDSAAAGKIVEGYTGG